MTLVARYWVVDEACAVAESMRTRTEFETCRAGERKSKDQRLAADRRRVAAEQEVKGLSAELMKKNDELGRLAVENAQLKDPAAASRRMMLENGGR